MKKNKIKYGGLTAFFIFAMCLAPGAVADTVNVIPIGEAVGIQVYTDGLLVVGFSDINGENIAKKNGIRLNDRIMEINGETAQSCEQLSDAVNKCPEGVELSVRRDNQDIMINAVPAMTENNVYRLGLWVRDSTAGIGTLTYYDPSSNTFAALGHGINDVDTGNILTVKSGNIQNCSILSVTKSEKGTPGEINGVFDGTKIGEISVNSDIGIFGSADLDSEISGNAIPVAAKEQLHEGEAYILTNVLGRAEKYTVNINKITSSADKELVIEVTDNRILAAAGGIVQGMSGSPIIQDGMLAGAVTHVFVNNPSKGYGALAENMIEMTNNIS